MAKITVMFGTEPQGEYTLDKPEVKIGRAMDCDIVVDNLGVSRHHCTIRQEGAGFAVVDGGSNNGTYVGGTRVSTQTLRDGDKIVLGKHSLIFDASGAATPGAGAKKGQAMGGEMTMFVDQAALAKAMAGGDGKRSTLALIQGGREVQVPLIKDETTIGSAGEVPVKGFLVKPIQAKIFKVGGVHRVTSLGGWRAVRVNGVRVADAALKTGDVIVIAGTTITYR
jgi:pSer/pThr/pTyr-binding forkhead associated (FHA) protein